MRKTMLNARTKLYAILGDPIHHSLSPVIMNGEFDRRNMDSAFLAFQVGKEDIQTAMHALRLFNLQGYVFTMPLKEIAISYMDELSIEAQIIQAVNCAKLEGGRLIGHNTDSRGFWQAIQNGNKNHVDIQKAFVLGMGGFARAAIAQLAIQGVKQITVANRFEDLLFMKTFSRFKQRLNQSIPDVRLDIVDWKPQEWREALSGAQLIANGTANGMQGKGDLDQIFPFEFAEQDAIVFDAVYNPLRTKFLQQAAGLGHTTIEGLELLVQQGICSFEIWTGIHVEAESMRESALQFLKATQNV